MYFEKLTTNRQIFTEQVLNLVDSTFNELGDETIKTISIDAPWGMGKSLLKDALCEKLTEKNIKNIAINAWETDYFNDPLKSLIGEINESQLAVSSDTIEKGNQLIKNIGLLGVKIASKIFLKNFHFTDEDISNIKSLIKGIDSSGTEEYKKYKNLINTFKSGFSDIERVIIIDELDRCKPTYAIELLEAIKHIFNIPKLTFIFLINKNQLTYTAENLYGCKTVNEDYFEKFFDIQLKLPDINIEDFIKIEYEKYSYNLENLMENEELNFEKFMKALLFKILESKYTNFHIKSVRQLKKTLNKYGFLIKTFTKNEKSSLLLILSFVGYFIYKEFYDSKDDSIKINEYFGFPIDNFFDDFLTKGKNCGGYSLCNNFYYNEKCLFKCGVVNNFYTILLNNNYIIVGDDNGFHYEKLTMDAVKIIVNFNWDNSQMLIPQPLGKEFIEKYGNSSIKEWCKEKYSFTYNINF